MISKYITYKEATNSQTAIRLGIDNTPDDEQLENMKYVAVNIFDKVREHFNTRLGISSFFRSKALNKAIKGSATSQHMLGEAIDIDADIYGKITNMDIFNYIKDNLEFDQLIQEYPKNGKPSWIHVSLKRNGINRNKIITIV